MKQKNSYARTGTGRRALIVGVLCGIVAAAGLSLGMFQTWSERVTDRLFLDIKPRGDIVIVGIDDASLGRLGRWPWPRSLHADLIKRLKDAGAKVIAYDVNFPEPSTASDDAALAASLSRAGNVILPVEVTLGGQGSRATFAPQSTVAPIAVLAAAAKATGFSNVPLDSDGIARSVPLLARGADGSSIRAFAVEAATAAGTAPDVSHAPLDGSGRFRIWFPGPPRVTFPSVSAADVLQGNVEPSRFEGKTVFVGVTARDLHDEQNVATSRGLPMSGVEIHASIYDALASGRSLQTVPLAVQTFFLLLLGILLGAFVTHVRPRTSAILIVLVGVGVLAAAFLLFDRGWILNVVWPILLIVIGYVALLLERWAETEAERRRIRHAFSRYVSPSVVEQILREPGRLKLGGERRRMSVLFSDLRGFTSLSEGLTPEQLVDVLNRYLDRMTKIVFEEAGVLDKYIGDACMAFWNAPLDQEDHAIRAVEAAVRMCDALAEMNRNHAFPSGIELKVGVGINTGEMVVGNIGADVRYDYTVIGDSVNLASRTEGLCKEYGVSIIVTEATAKEAGERFLFRRLDRVAVKGKKEPITIFQVMGFAATSTDDDRNLATQYDAALSSYLNRAFAEAVGRCDALLARFPDDVATKQLKVRAVTFRDAPPPQDWDGVWVMTKK